VQNLFSAGITGVCVILDEKQLTSKDLARWSQRTEAVFSGGPTIHDFSANLLALFPVKSHNDGECVRLVERLGLSLLVNGGTPRKLAGSLLQSVPQGVINVHPGVLPKYRGSSCVEWAILNDDQVGNTAHFMSEGYDEGPIIRSESYSFTPEDTYVSIRAKVYRESLRLMSETVAMALHNGMKCSDGIPQSHGECFRPITDAEMRQVLEKVAEKRYRFMRNGEK
jgi:methionyl-tRNA formyltransferase